MSFVKITNRVGPKMDPCGIPLPIFCHFDEQAILSIDSYPLSSPSVIFLSKMLQPRHPVLHEILHVIHQSHNPVSPDHSC
jgi:hypothetical protein